MQNFSSHLVNTMSPLCHRDHGQYAHKHEHGPMLTNTPMVKGPLHHYFIYNSCDKSNYYTFKTLPLEYCYKMDTNLLHNQHISSSTLLYM